MFHINFCRNLQLSEPGFVISVQLPYRNERPMSVFILCQKPYHADRTGSRGWSVFEWVTAWEHRMLPFLPRLTPISDGQQPLYFYNFWPEYILFLVVLLATENYKKNSLLVHSTLLHSTLHCHQMMKFFQPYKNSHSSGRCFTHSSTLLRRGYWIWDNVMVSGKPPRRE